ncbi:MAG: hypothetical protein QN174_02425, partial [Armatimonadota bacterium]|nr:hypothetical protein [Armatimonadota bacterium]
MHPFHGDDYFRFTPLGLRLLFARTGLEVVRLEAPLWAFSVMAQGLVAVVQRLGFGRLERPIEATAGWLDRRLRSPQRGAAFAAAYLVEGRRQRS